MAIIIMPVIQPKVRLTQYLPTLETPYPDPVCTLGLKDGNLKAIIPPKVIILLI